MKKSFWIVGTDTEVGKTVVTTYFMLYFQKMGKTTPYKAVQTGIIEEDGVTYYGDTQFYQSYSEEHLVEEHLNTYSFKEPASPHYAAMLEEASIDEGVILKQIEELTSTYDYVICEGAGGLYVPLDGQRNYHFLQLIKESRLPVVLVSRTKLGTINHTLLSIEALKNRGIPIVGIVFNAYEGTGLEVNNMNTIHQFTGLPSLVIPKLENLSDIKSVQIEQSPFFERLLNL